MAVLVVVAIWFFATLVRQREDHQRALARAARHHRVFFESVFRQNTTEDILWDIASSCIEKLGLKIASSI